MRAAGPREQIPKVQGRVSVAPGFTGEEGKRTRSAHLQQLVEVLNPQPVPSVGLKGTQLQLFRPLPRRQVADAILGSSQVPAPSSRTGPGGPLVCMVADPGSGAKLLEFSLILHCRVAAGHQEGLGVCKEPVGRDAGRTCRGGEGLGHRECVGRNVRPQSASSPSPGALSNRRRQRPKGLRVGRGHRRTHSGATEGHRLGRLRASPHCRKSRRPVALPETVPLAGVWGLCDTVQGMVPRAFLRAGTSRGTQA